MRWVWIVVGCLLALAVVSWFFFTRRHPENASDPGTFGDGSPRQAKKNDRPGGPSVDDGPGRDAAASSHAPLRATDPEGGHLDAGEEGRS